MFIVRKRVRLTLEAMSHRGKVLFFLCFRSNKRNWTQEGKAVDVSIYQQLCFAVPVCYLTSVALNVFYKMASEIAGRRYSSLGP